MISVFGFGLIFDLKIKVKIFDFYYFSINLNNGKKYKKYKQIFEVKINKWVRINLKL